MTATCASDFVVLEVLSKQNGIQQKITSTTLFIDKNFEIRQIEIQIIALHKTNVHMFTTGQCIGRSNKYSILIIYWITSPKYQLKPFTLLRNVLFYK